MAEQLALFAPRRPAAPPPPPAPATCPRWPNWTSSAPCTAVSEGRAACPGAAPCEQLGEPERERIERSFWGAEVRLGPPGQPPTPPASATPREGIHRVEYRCDCGFVTGTMAALRDHVATHPARVPVTYFPKRSPAPVDESAATARDLVHPADPAPQSDAPGPVDEQHAAPPEIVHLACRGCGAPARVVYAAGVPPLELAGPRCRTCADGIIRTWMSKEVAP